MMYKIFKEINSYKYYYTTTNHLGSITTVMDEEGDIVAEQSFDAWGRRRSVNSWSTDSTDVVPSWLYRGYTGHEMLDSFQLINMNGRLYDPVIARMLSPDPFVQAPNSLQNYNRYSYVMNNPLSYTDPSGYNYTSDGRWVDAYATNSNNYNDANHTGWDPSMGFTAMFNIVSNQYGTLAAMMAANNGFSSGPGMGFGSSFAGRGITSHTKYNLIVTAYVSFKDELGKLNSQTNYGFDSELITSYERGSLSSEDPMSNAVACNGCDFVLGLKDGAIGGLRSTIGFAKSLTTYQGWKDFAVSNFNNALLVTAPGVYFNLNPEVLPGALNFVQTLPDRTAYEWGYGLGFGMEKVAEALILKRVGTFTLRASQIGFGGAMYESSIFGRSSFLFGRAPRPVGTIGYPGLLNSNNYLRIGWGWEGSGKLGTDVFRIGIFSGKQHPHLTLFKK